MATVAKRGKKQDKTIEGQIRIEYGNDKIVFTQNGQVISEVSGNGQSFYTPDGLVYHVGRLPDGRYGAQLLDPETGIEIMRSGILPDDSSGVAVAKDGIDLPDAY